MTLVLVGDKSVSEMEKMGKKYFGGVISWSDDGRVGCVCDKGSELGKDFYLKQCEKRVETVKAPLNHSFICLAFPMDVMTNSLFAASEVLGNIVAGNMMSRLFVELREKRGLVYNVKFMMDMYRDGGTFMITLSTHNRGSEIKRLLKLFLKS